jgi:protein-disulfide isomerase
MSKRKRARNRREQPQAQPQAQPQPRAASRPPRRRASRRTLLIAGVALVLAVVAIAVGVLVTSSSSKQEATLPANALPHAAAVQKLLDGIPQDRNVLGDPSAPATMVEYLDVQCPYCKDYETRALPKLITDYVRPGKLKLEVRPIAGLGDDSAAGRAALVEAGHQGKFFNLLELLYWYQREENSGWLDAKLVRSVAKNIPGLEVEPVVSALLGNPVSSEIQAFDNQAQSDNVEVTPTILVGKTGGPLKQVTLVSSIDENTVPNAVDAALR